MNQFSLNLQPSPTLWYPPMDHQHQLKPYPFHHHHHNNGQPQPPPQIIYDELDADRSETSSSTTTTAEKSHMFEKPLTPSDVGKLNRLVIPKQHAEKYFPLAAATTTSDGGGGLLLGFEDETGKCWRFRYSYWNSSQSYVLTKGWSRYVKDKKLDAGDVVFFDRHRFDSDRFFIGWRRRGSNPPVQPGYNYSYTNNHRHNNNNNNNNNNNDQNNNVVESQQIYVPSHQINSVIPSYIPDSVHAGIDGSSQKVKKSGSGKSRRVRLFGVNLECELEEVIEDEPQTSDGSSISSHGQGIALGLGSSLSTRPTSYNYFDYMGYPPP